MAKVYFDTNFFIDLINRRTKVNLHQFLGHQLHITPLSIHIYAYTYKIAIPNESLKDYTKFFNLISLTKTTINRSLQGPTNDLEDNIQLHSASQASCQYFLTRDKPLLKLKQIGSTKIISNF